MDNPVVKNKTDRWTAELFSGVVRQAGRRVHIISVAGWLFPSYGFEPVKLYGQYNTKEAIHAISPKRFTQNLKCYRFTFKKQSDNGTDAHPVVLILIKDVDHREHNVEVVLKTAVYAEDENMWHEYEKKMPSTDLPPLAYLDNNKHDYECHMFERLNAFLINKKFFEENEYEVWPRADKICKREWKMESVEDDVHFLDLGNQMENAEIDPACQFRHSYCRKTKEEGVPCSRPKRTPCKVSTYKKLRELERRAEEELKRQRDERDRPTSTERFVNFLAPQLKVINDLLSSRGLKVVRGKPWEWKLEEVSTGKMNRYRKFEDKTRRRSREYDGVECDWSQLDAVTTDD